MSVFKAVIDKFFRPWTYTAETEKPKAKIVRCHDCGEIGHIALYADGSYQLRPGWKMAWVGLRSFYTCPACGEKRRQFALKCCAKSSTKK